MGANLELKTAAPRTSVRDPARVAEYNNVKSKVSFHIFSNKTDESLRLYWYVDGHPEKFHCDVPPQGHRYIGTYLFHKWRLSDSEGNVKAEYSGPSAVIELLPSGESRVILNGESQGRDAVEADAAVANTSQRWGNYSERDRVCGVPIMAFDCVSKEAVQAARLLLERMLQDAHADVKERLVAAGAQLGIVGRKQALTDMPYHSFMRFMVDRDVDATARGLGGTSTVPVTSVGEENLLMDDDNRWTSQSLLVHEFGHALLNLGVSTQQVARVCQLYGDARREGRFRADAYLMTNEQEYWATGVEAWFESTIREDVNDGMITREAVKQRDPALAEMLTQLLGDGQWRYHHDALRPLRHRSHRRPLVNEDGGNRSVVTTNAGLQQPAPVEGPVAWLGSEKEEGSTAVQSGNPDGVVGVVGAPQEQHMAGVGMGHVRQDGTPGTP